MKLEAAEAPLEVDFVQESEKEEQGKKAVLDKLDGRTLKQRALSLKKVEVVKEVPAKRWSDEVVSKYVDDLALYVNWCADEGQLEFKWDCSKLERDLITLISEDFKAKHGGYMTVIESSSFILCDWSGDNEV